MKAKKFRVVPCLLFTLAALLTVPSASIAQTQSTAATTAPTVTRFHFTDNGDDLAGRMTTDASGNFYVSAALSAVDPLSHASGFAVLKYDFNGKLQGAFRYKNAPGEFQGVAQAVKVDKHGNIYAAGFTTVSGLVVSFTSSGVQRWADRFGGGAGNPVALAIDASGNIYAAGNVGHGGSDGVGPILEWAIVKYSSTGQVLWEQRHTGDPSLDSRVADVQLDSEGNPIVLGTTSNSLATLTNKMTLVKFDPHGDTLWAKDFTVPHNSQIPGGLVIDTGGNVYATSRTNPPEGIATPFTVKYDPSGVLKFVLQGKDAGGVSVAIDPAGDVLLTGDTINFGTSTFIEATKIRPSGARVWTTQIAATGKIVTDSAGNVFVAASGFVITKLSPAGRVLFSSSLLPGDDVTDAVVDPFGNLIATGDGLNAQFEHDIFTLRLK
ncbi:MAG TPA: hypothetical protein VF783_11870 [Terriglobales bacterium]